VKEEKRREKESVHNFVFIYNNNKENFFKILFLLFGLLYQLIVKYFMTSKKRVEKARKKKKKEEKRESKEKKEKKREKKREKEKTREKKRREKSGKE
jgi:predicted membrane protein